MEQNDFLARQRGVIRAFRQAEALRAEQEAEADKQLAEACEQLEEGRTLLKRVALTHLLDKALPFAPKAPAADPAARLARSVGAASQAVADLGEAVEALIRFRERRQGLITAAVIASIFLCAVLAFGSYKAYRQFNLAWHHRQAVAAIKAEEWEKAAEEIIAIQPVDPAYPDIVEFINQEPALREALDRAYAQKWRSGEVGLWRTLNHTSYVSSVAFSPDGNLLASGLSSDVWVWQISNGELLYTLEGGKSKVESIAFSPKGKVLAAGSYCSKSKQGIGCVSSEIWWISGEKLLHIPEAHTAWVWSVAFSPDGSILASGSGDETVRLWRVSDGELLRTLKGHEAWVRSVAFSPDGSILASGSADYTIRLWRVSDGELLRTLKGHTSVVESVAFSPDGSLLASGSWDETVRLWRVSDGELLHTLKGHTWDVSSVAFSPDGSILASGSDDKTVRLWRVSDGKLLRTLKGHKKYVSSVAFSPDGSILASGAGDNTVRLWGPR